MTDNAKRMIALMGRMRDMQLVEGPLKNTGMSLPQVALLSWVSHSPGCHVQDLAKGMGLTAPTVSVGIHRLVRLGLIRRERDPEDKRARLLYLTDKAEKIMVNVRQFQYQSIQRFLSRLDEKEQDQLVNLLEKAVYTAEQERAAERERAADDKRPREQIAGAKE
jgi:DNA-binding MarR family transcriptional regulator